MWRCKLEASETVEHLEKLESQTVFYTLAMMSYNPSIGRVLERRGVNKFVHIAFEAFLEIDNIQTRDEFDSWHERFVEKIRNQIKTASGKEVSYGQAQKPINDFLKVYVDWARLPKIDASTRLCPHLHVPLDKVMMTYTKLEFLPYYQKYNLIFASLAEIEKDSYNRWQKCFRELSPKKPLLMDVFWAKEHFNLR